MKYRLKAASGGHTGQTFDLGDQAGIGSGESCDLRLEGLEEAHARIERRDGGLILRSNGDARVNGEPVPAQRQRALQSGDELQFGPHRFVLQAPGLKPVRVLDRLPERSVGWKWLAAAGVLAAAAGIAWWVWF